MASKEMASRLVDDGPAGGTAASPVRGHEEGIRIRPNLSVTEAEVDLLIKMLDRCLERLQ